MNRGMNRARTEGLMKRLVEQYLDKHGTEGYKDFKKFMRSKGVDTTGITELVYKRM